MTVIAGPYRFKAQVPGGALTDIGATERGMVLTPQSLGQPFSFDGHGETIVDGINTGKKVILEIVAFEYSAAGLAVVFPEGAGEGVIGELWSVRAAKIVAEPINGKGNLQYTFWKCKCLEPVALVFSGTAPLQIPMKFLLLPDYTVQDQKTVFYKEEVARG